jgi:SulP family sulfate permease
VDELREDLARAGTVFALARVKHDLLARLESCGLAGKIGPDRLYPTLPTAVAAYEAWACQHPNDQRPGETASEAG